MVSAESLILPSDLPTERARSPVGSYTATPPVATSTVACSAALQLDTPHGIDVSAWPSLAAPGRNVVGRLGLFRSVRIHGQVDWVNMLADPTHPMYSVAAKDCMEPVAVPMLQLLTIHRLSR